VNNQRFFKPAMMDRDQYVEYEHENYTWLESVRRYQHNTDQGGEFDTMRINIPGRTCDQPSCHYVVAWSWRGYYDCIDVTFFQNPINASLVDGAVNEASPFQNQFGSFDWEKIDHCMYDNPGRVLTPITKTTEQDGARPCADLLTESAWFTSNFVPTQRTPSGLFEGAFSHSYGISVGPVKTPAGSFQVNHLPVTDPFAAQDPEVGIRLRNGAKTMRGINWAAWAAAGSTNAIADSRCGRSLWQRNLTLMDAVLTCDADLSRCDRISTQEADPDAVGLYWGCDLTDASNDASMGWTTYENTVTAPAYSSPSTLVARVSFKDPDSSVVTPSGFLEDSGGAYGANGGQTFGWVCPDGTPSGT
jgi:hypothetical protein